MKEQEEVQEKLAGSDEEWEQVINAAEEEGEDKGGEVQEPEEEAAAPKYMRDPGEPSQKDRDEHEILHLYYRPWCKWCVMGKGQSDDHMTVPKDIEEIAIPTISMDYMFLGTKNIKAKDRTVLALFDNRTKSVMALMVHNKGPVEWAMNAAVKFIENLGYGKVAIAIKCDNEPSILAVRDAITNKRTAPTTPLDTPVREAQGNGSMERTVKTLQGQYRTLLAQLVDNIGDEIKENYDVLQWLANWVSMTLNRYKLQSHGKTAFQLSTGHSCRRPVTAFGEKILWKKSSKPGTRRDKGDSDFAEGIYLGVTGRTIESLIGTPNGLERAYTVRRLPKSQRWAPDDMIELQCPMPHSLYGPQEDEINVNAVEPPIPHSPVNVGIEGDVNTEEPGASPSEPSPNAGPGDMAYSPTSPAKSGTPSWLGDDMVHTPEREDMQGDTPSPLRRVQNPRRYRIDSDDDMEGEDASKRGKVEREPELFNSVVPSGMVQQALSGVDLSEIYSPERVVKFCREYNLLPGDSFDLQTGWDFDKLSHRNLASRRVLETRPKLLICSPPCTLFSILQNLNIAVHGPEWEMQFKLDREKATRHLSRVQNCVNSKLRKQIFYL